MQRSVTNPPFPTRKLGIAAIALAVVLCALVLYGWRTQPSSPKVSHHASITSQAPQPVDSGNKQYLNIEEWRVRIKLPKALQGDISYTMNDRAAKDFGGVSTVDFLSKTFSAGPLPCAVVENDMPRSLVSIYMEVDGSGGKTEDPTAFKHIGNTRYYFAPTACAEAIARSGSAEDKELLTELKQTVANTLESY